MEKNVELNKIFFKKSQCRENKSWGINTRVDQSAGLEERKLRDVEEVGRKGEKAEDMVS